MEPGQKVRSWNAALRAIRGALDRGVAPTVRPWRRELEDELRITLDARRELGSGYDTELTERFVRQLEDAIERRIEELWREHERRRRRATIGKGLTLLLVLTAAVPLTLVAGLTAGAQGIGVVWVALIALVVLAGLVHRD